MVEYALRHHKRIGIVCDNANALTSKDMRKYLDGIGDAVEILHLPPHTPQLNPTDTMAGDQGSHSRSWKVDRCHTIQETPIVKLYQWLL